MNMQYSYNNFDYKYMHKGQLPYFFCYTYFCVDGLLTFFKDPKTRLPERGNGHTKTNDLTDTWKR